LSVESSGVATGKGIAGYHAETFWEGKKFLSNISHTLPGRYQRWHVRTAQGNEDVLVVDRRTTGLVHTNEATVLRLEVQRWNPVVGHILGDGAGGAGRSSRLSIVHSESETITTHDGVGMVRHLASTNNRIGAFGDDGNFAR